MKWCFIDLA